MRSGEEHKLCSFVFGGPDFFVNGGHVFAFAPVEDGHVAAFAQRGPGGIDGGVASADDAHAPSQVHFLASGDRLQKVERRVYAFQLGARLVDP